MPENQDRTVVIEGARIFYLNFAGKETQYNRAGERNFCVELPPDLAETMAKDGWNVRQTNPREEGDEPIPYLPVEVSYKNKPPRITMIRGNNRVNMTEDMVDTLDYADIENVDLIVNPYDWVVGGKGGIKAYLKTMFVTIREDYLEQKYRVNDPKEV